jgi:hypothetical protein
MGDEAGVDPAGQQRPARSGVGFGFVRKLALVAPVLLPYLILAGTGLLGLGYGKHWGEKLHLKRVDRSIATGTLLPDRFYQYPSVTYWMAFGSLGPPLVSILLEEGSSGHAVAARDGDKVGIRDRLRAVVLSRDNILRTRGIFLLVSSLAVVWVYLLQLAWGRHWSEALLAAMILAGSWEVAYHARWIAPDSVLMQFGALTMLFVVLAWKRPERRVWLWLAAVAAGLAVGTKYPSGLLLVPLLLVAYRSWDRVSVLRGLVPVLFGTLAIFGLSYLITTPGTVLQPLDFLDDVLFEIHHYYEMGLAGHTVSGGSQHLGINVTYIVVSLLSRFDPIAVALFGLSLLGVYAMVRESRRAAVIFLAFPVLYVLFMSIQSIMIPRNLQIVAPFLAVLAARGIGQSWRWIPRGYPRAALVGVVATVLAANVAWLAYAAQTVRDRDSDRFIREAVRHIEEHPQTRFFVSDKVWADLAALGEAGHPNVTRDGSARVDEVLFYTSEALQPPRDRPATRRNLTITWFGPWEVNLNYYPSWAGGDRIMLTYVEPAHALGIAVADPPGAPPDPAAAVYSASPGGNEGPRRAPD